MADIKPIEIPGVAIQPADPARLAELRRSGVDHGANVVEGFLDAEGGWPLRCCLRDSEAGERLAIVAWAPFPWRGPYAEVGPIVIHEGDCGGRSDGTLPVQLLTRPQVLRPYGRDRRLLYDDIVVVDEAGSLPDALARVLAGPHVDLVLARNLRAGCYSFTAVPRRRALPS